VRQDQDRQDGKMEVIIEPTMAQGYEAFAGEDHLCQDKVY
jgi:hypothetical protein